VQSATCAGSLRQRAGERGEGRARPAARPQRRGSAAFICCNCARARPASIAPARPRTLQAVRHVHGRPAARRDLRDCRRSPASAGFGIGAQKSPLPRSRARGRVPSGSFSVGAGRFDAVADLAEQIDLVGERCTAL
jgi:hypothetical protein